MKYLLLAWDLEVLEPAELTWVCFSLLNLSRYRHIEVYGIQVSCGRLPPLYLPLQAVWGLFTDKHLLRQSVLAFPNHHAGGLLVFLSQDS